MGDLFRSKAFWLLIALVFEELVAGLGWSFVSGLFGVGPDDIPGLLLTALPVLVILLPLVLGFSLGRLSAPKAGYIERPFFGNIFPRRLSVGVEFADDVQCFPVESLIMSNGEVVNYFRIKLAISVQVKTLENPKFILHSVGTKHVQCRLQAQNLPRGSVTLTGDEVAYVHVASGSTLGKKSYSRVIEGSTEQADAYASHGARIWFEPIGSEGKPAVYEGEATTFLIGVLSDNRVPSYFAFKLVHDTSGPKLEVIDCGVDPTKLRLSRQA